MDAVRPKAVSSMEVAQREAIAARFVSARRDARSLDDYPGVMPESLEEAYAIQGHAIALQGTAVGGWKIGRIQAPDDAYWRINRLAGPIFADQIVLAAGKSVDMPVIAGGFAAAEAEFLMHIGADADVDKLEWSMAEARALVDRVAIGIEIASSPLSSINDLGPAVTVSDFGNNYGLLIGSDLPAYLASDLDSISVTVSINGLQVGAGKTAEMPDGPWGAVRFIAAHAARHGMPLVAGQWISTGAITGVHGTLPGDRVEAMFADMQVGCAITAAEATVQSGHTTWDRSD